MKKIIKSIVAILILVVMMSLQVSYAVSSSNANVFLKANKEEIKQGETLEIAIDLSKIDSDEFTLNLTSNIDMKDIVIKENIETNLDITTNSIKIEIDKSEITVSKITLTYILSEDENVEETIKFIAQVLEVNGNNNQLEVSKEEKLEILISSEETTKTTEEKDLSKNDSKTENNKDNKNETSQNSIKDNNTQESEKDEKNNKEKSSDKNKNSNNTIASALKSQSSSISNSVKSMASSMTSQATSVETAVYNGSSNNYLSSLEIEGVTLKTTFNKEKETYFAEAEGLTSVNVTATKENENAKVYITGASSLKTGTNKILVSVTAENGNVRYYRIFLENK